LRPLLEEIAGAGVRLVDSAEATARETAAVLAAQGLFRSGGAEGSREYFVTDDTERFGATATRFLGSPIPHLERVDLDA
jgi:glutamate racemase